MGIMESRLIHGTVGFAIGDALGLPVRAVAGRSGCCASHDHEGLWHLQPTSRHVFR